MRARFTRSIARSAPSSGLWSSSDDWPTLTDTEHGPPLALGGDNHRGSLAFFGEGYFLLSQFLLGISESKIMILLMINLMLLILGMIMDMAALILICTPIFLPVVIGLDMDPLQFGIIMMMNLGLGLCTPPVGACLFVGCAIGGVKIEDAVKTIWPFYLAILVALMLVTYVPAISMTLPGLID